MNTRLHTTFRALRPATRREAQINLAQVRAWYAANSTAYGFVALKDLFRERVTTVGIETVNTAMTDSIEMYQRELDEMLDWLVERTTVPKRRFLLPNSGTLQPLDQWGNPLPRQPGGSYEVAFPIQGGGDAWGNNRITRAKMTVAEANQFTLNVQMADLDWMKRHILAALFTNTTWTYSDPDDEIGDLTIQPLANNDTVVYLRRGAGASTDNHYLAQANAIDNSNDPYPTIEAEISEHPSNNGDVVAFIPSNLVAATMALSAFIPANDSNIQRSISSDAFIGDEIQGFGDKFLGYHESGVKLVEWKSLPSSYILGGSEDPGAPAVAMREHPEAELQGLFPEFHDVDGNRQLFKFLRYAGFGVQNRIAMLVMRIGNGSYAIPTGYTAPLAV